MNHPVIIAGIHFINTLDRGCIQMEQHSVNLGDKILQQGNHTYNIFLESLHAYKTHESASK